MSFLLFNLRHLLKLSNGSNNPCCMTLFHSKCINDYDGFGSANIILIHDIYPYVFVYRFATQLKLLLQRLLGNITKIPRLCKYKIQLITFLVHISQRTHHNVRSSSITMPGLLSCSIKSKRFSKRSLPCLTLIDVFRYSGGSACLLCQNTLSQL